MKSKFDRVIGYADFDDVNNQKLKQKVLVLKNIISDKSKNNEINKMLVAGCGDGTEAKLMKNIFDCKITGVDISLEYDDLSDDSCVLLKQDLGNLSFPNDYYDFIYSYHVLEHVPDPKIVLRELHRVLKPGGNLFIGFPNKNRLIGYIGAHNNVSWQEKLLWNLKDYRDRMAGKFENKYGAHAGFTQKEFLKIGNEVYKEIIPVRNDYMRLKYSGHKRIINSLIKLKVSDFLFPSNYFLCLK